MGHQPEEVIAGRIPGTLLPHLIQKLHRPPGQGEGPGEFLLPHPDLAGQERVEGDGLAEGFPGPGIFHGFGQGPLRQGHAAHAVGHPGNVQGFQDQIDSFLRLPQEPGLGVLQEDLPGGDGTGPDLVLEALDGVVQGSILAEPGQKKQREAPDGAGRALRTGGHDGIFRTGVAGEIFQSGEIPPIPFPPGHGFHPRTEIRTAPDLGHPGGPLRGPGLPGHFRQHPLPHALRRVFVDGHRRGNAHRIGTIEPGVPEGGDIAQEEERPQGVFLKHPPDVARPVTLVQQLPVFGRIQDLVHPFPPLVIHPEPGRAGPVHRGRHRRPFLHPPGFIRGKASHLLFGERHTGM